MLTKRRKKLESKSTPREDLVPWFEAGLAGV